MKKMMHNTRDNPADCDDVGGCDADGERKLIGPNVI
jgi:hypothetical protein